MDWRLAYNPDEEKDADDPFPKMLDDHPDNMLGPFVATELPLVERVCCRSSDVDMHAAGIFCCAAQHTVISSLAVYLGAGTAVC
jgi:hypothetical protein